MLHFLQIPLAGDNGPVKTYRLIIAALVCAVVIPLAFVVQLLIAR